MPGLLDRPKLSPAMAAALKHHILKERERKRQEEEEADKAIERKREEQEKLRKKAEAESLSLEETKDQIKSLEDKLKSLQTDKHELFLQLKKVLNEDENRRQRQQLKEKNEIMLTMGHHQYHPTMHMPGPHMIVQSAHLPTRPAMLDKTHLYRSAAAGPQPAQGMHGVKRTRSPSPPVVELYPKHPVQQGPYAQGPYGQTQSHGSYRQSHQVYTTSQANSSYINPTLTTFTPSQQAMHASYVAPTSQTSAGKYPARESAFSSYPNHFVTQQQKGLAETYPQGYQVQPQRYLHSSQAVPAGSIAVHPQQAVVDQSVKQGPFTAPEDQGHYQHKLQGQHARQLGSGHPQALHSQQAMLSQPQGQPQVHLQQAQQGKPNMSSSYQPRRKPESPIYQHKKPAQQHQPAQPQQHQPAQPQQHGASYQSPQPPQRHGNYPSQTQHQQGQSGSRYYSGM